MKWFMIAAFAAVLLFTGTASAASHFYRGGFPLGGIITSHPNYGWHSSGYRPGISVWSGASRPYFGGYGYGGYYSTPYYQSYSMPYYQTYSYPYYGYSTPSPNYGWSGGYYCN